MIQFIFTLTFFSSIYLQSNSYLALGLFCSPRDDLLKIIISPYHFSVLLDYFLVICDPSHCSLGLNLHINHIIILFTIFSSRNILSEYCLVVLLVSPGLWWGCLFLLFLSPTLSLIFFLLFNPLCCLFSIILFRSSLRCLLDQCSTFEF